MPAVDQEVYFQDWDSLATGAQRLREEGWTVLPADEPEKGVRAFRAEREGDPVRPRLVWLPWGRELRSAVTLCATWQEFVAALELRRDEDMEKCDLVAESQVGFACYGRASAQGVCEVFRIGVAALQAGGAEARSKLIALLTSSKHPGAEALKGVRASEMGRQGR